MASQDIQALADELAKLNRNSTLWAQPQMQQSGAAAMMTQSQVQLQPYMQNYSHATPGAQTPASQFGDPRAANYALQQQYYLNPYRAQAYGGQFNENMPGAEFSTSSRLGIYRPGQQGTQQSGFAQPGFFGDVATLSGFKSYAGYQNPYEAQISASRRMSQRAEAIGVGGLEAAGLAASFAIPGVAGMAAGMAGLPIAAYGAQQYFSRREETGQIHDVMKDLVSGTSTTSLGGRGIGMGQSANMMRDMRLTAASDSTKSIEDYQTILQTGAATGLFNFEDSGGEVMDKVKQASKMVNSMMMLAEDPDIQSTIKRMSDFQAMGVSIGQMDRMATDMKGFANLANTSFEQVMSNGGALGAQQAQMMGGSAAFGMRAGGMAQGMANRMLQSGQFTAEEAALRGGKSGMMQTASGMMTNDIHSYLSTRAAYFMNEDGSVNQESLDQLVSGKGGDTVGKTLDRFSGMNKSKYLMFNEDATAQAESSLKPMDMINIQRAIRDDHMKQANISEEQYYASKGKAGRELEYMLSDANVADTLVTSSQVRREKRSQAFAEQEQAGHFYNKIGRSITQAKEEFFDSDIYTDIAKREDRRAAKAAGRTIKASMDDIEGISKENTRRFNQFQTVTSSKSSRTEAILEGKNSVIGLMQVFGAQADDIKEEAEAAGLSVEAYLDETFDELDAASIEAQKNPLKDDEFITQETKEKFEKKFRSIIKEEGSTFGESGEFSLKGMKSMSHSEKVEFLQHLAARGTKGQMQEYKKITQISQQGKQDALQKDVNEFQGDFTKGVGLLGKEGMTAFSNLRANFSVSDIKTMMKKGGIENLKAMGRDIDSGTIKKLNTLNKVEGGFLAAIGSENDELMSGLPGMSSEQSTLMKADKHIGNITRFNSSPEVLAREFAMASDDLGASLEDIKDQATDAKQAEDLMNKAGSTLAEDGIKKVAKGKNSDDPNEKSSSHLESIEGMLKDFMAKNGLTAHSNKNTIFRMK